MDIKLLLTVFGTVFLAELGDKTQLATMLFASRDNVNLWFVFIGSALALVASSAIGVLVGAELSNYIDTKYLSYIAGVAFILIGAWTLWSA